MDAKEKEANEDETSEWTAIVLAKIVNDVSLALTNDPPNPMPRYMKIDAILNENIRITLRIDLKKLD